MDLPTKIILNNLILMFRIFYIYTILGNYINLTMKLLWSICLYYKRVKLFDVQKIKPNT